MSALLSQPATNSGAGTNQPPVTPRERRGRGAARWVVLVLAGLFALLMLAPLLLLVLNAFKTGADYSANGPLALPEHLSVEAFQQYLEIVDYPRALLNSVVISGLVALLGTALALITSYGIGIGRIRGRTWILAVFLLATMLPQESLIYPLFYGAQATGLFNTVWSVVIVFTVLQAAFGTYLLSSVMSTIPQSLLEAAALDGAGRLRILWSVVFPVLRPTLSVLVVFFFVWTWNEFYIPLVLLSDQSAQTIPIALATLQGQNSINLTALNAGSLLSLLPTLVFFLIFQRTLSRGVTVGAVK
ncbi:raffinose/stachyose/melibiose transport system permease protein [Curtobacterium pusillum]|uniref:Raffinose/stachyose/melibiose transport system permease protein n=1 Tax=Curtobacterium pusillum TaxID=69373 RepID=A0AAW3TED9_9MICO|nr:carbohydrate ABC transporter permease [Curtobacterium pusillum]MBA8992043.1 raffinose/stachyose/melibiose transport system permease protein [Curtobacterium pusillum]